jgi:hypothetical protein
MARRRCVPAVRVRHGYPRSSMRARSRGSGPRGTGQDMRVLAAKRKDIQTARRSSRQLSGRTTKRGARRSVPVTESGREGCVVRHFVEIDGRWREVYTYTALAAQLDDVPAQRLRNEAAYRRYEPAATEGQVKYWLPEQFEMPAEAETMLIPWMEDAS